MAGQTWSSPNLTGAVTVRTPCGVVSVSASRDFEVGGVAGCGLNAGAAGSLDAGRDEKGAPFETGGGP